MKFLGIDPGAGGAVAVIDETKDGLTVEVFDTPTIEVKVGKTYRRRPNLSELFNLLLQTACRESYAVIEAVQPQPQFGASSMFWLGHSLGTWESLLTAASIPYQTVRSQQWKKTFGIVGDARTKGAARAIAIKLFPQAASRLARVKDDGRGEALLMAEHARRTYRGPALQIPEQPCELFREERTIETTAR